MKFDDLTIVPRNELYPISKKDSVSLYSFLESEKASEFLSKEDISDYLNWIKIINNKNKMESGFYKNLEKIFTLNNNLEFITGQQDYGAIQVKDNVVMVYHSEMGIYISLTNKKDNFNFNEMKKEDWKAVDKMLSILDTGFSSANDFHSLLEFHKMNKELDNKESIKEKKSKI